MATLFNTKISATYEGLFKTIDNAAITASLKELTDGSGNQSGLYVNTAGDFKVSNILEWGSLKDTGTGVTITRYVTSTDGIENFDNNTSLPTSAAVKLYVDSKFATSDTLQEVLSFGNTTGGNDIVVSASDDITFTDTSKILMGASSDFQIYHDGSNSIIKDLGTGNLKIQSDGLGIDLTKGSTEFLAKFIIDGANELYFNNVKKFETTNTGVDITGNLVVSGSITGAGGSFLPLAGGTMTGNISMGDNIKSVYGANSELEIYSNNGTSFIKETGTGNLEILADSLSLLNAAGSEYYARFYTNGASYLYNNGVAKLNTTGTGVEVIGALSTTTDVTVGANATFVDNGKAIFGAGSDLQIYHNGTNQDKIESLSSFLILESSNLILRNNGGSEDYAKFFGNGGAELYYDNIKRLETLTDGAKVTGNLEVTGTITGSGGSFLPLAGGTMTGNTIHNDNVKSIYGTASDGLEIFHDGVSSYIIDTGSGTLNVRGSTQVNIGGVNGQIGFQYVEGANTSMRHNNITKLSTLSTGITVTGNGAFTGSVQIPNAGQLQLGTGLHMLLQHNSANGFIKNLTGQLNIDQAAVTQSIVFRVSDANSLDTTALTISRNADASFGRDVTIAGDLTVNGTTTTVNSQTLAVVDPLIQLAKDNTANSLDIGLYGDYNDGTDRFLGLFSDASDGNKFKLFKGTTVEPTTTVNIGATGYVAADLEVAGLEATTISTSGTVSVGNTLYVTEYIQHLGDTNNNIRFQTGRMILQSKASGSAKIDLHDNGSLFLNSGGGTALTLDTSQNATFVGQVKIDSTAGYKLSVEDSASFLFYGATDATTGSVFRLRSNNKAVTIVDIDATGNSTFAGDVGIVLTDTNSVKLGITGNSGLPATSGTTQTGLLRLKASNNATLDMGADHINAVGWLQVTDVADLSSEYNLLLQPNGGNVGIGGFPNYELDVVGSIKASVQSRFANGSASTPAYSFDGDSDTGIYRATTNALGFSTAGTNRLTIDSSGNSTFAGNVGIGGTPSVQLEVVGSTYSLIRVNGANTNDAGIDFGDADDNDIGRIRYENTDDSMRIWTNNAERMRITAQGEIYNADSAAPNNNTYYGHFGGYSLTSGTGNTTFGTDAGPSITTGIGNNYFGHFAGRYSTTGSYNVAIGQEALERITVGSANIAIGRAAGTLGDFSETVFVGALAGYQNTQGATVGIGNEALKNNTAVDNTGVGHRALINNTSGEGNTALGFRTLDTNTIQGYNTAIGSEALRNNNATGNTAVGRQAGLNITTGNNNTLMGRNAGDSITDGIGNVALGFQAYQAGSNNYNTVLGYQAAYNSNTSNAVMIGFRAGYANTAISNTFIGGEAGRNNTSGTTNVFVGADAGYKNETGFSNTYVGQQAGTYQEANDNTAVGTQALFGVDNASTTADRNVALGVKAGKGVTSGDDNILIGVESGFVNNSGYRNIFIGTYAGKNLTVSFENTLIGYQSGINATGGNYNTALGAFSLRDFTSADRCTAIGRSALINNTTGDFNTALGMSAGEANVNGSNNVFLGYNSGTSHISGSNVLIIGSGANGSSSTVSNEITLGNANIGVLRCAATSITSLSDKRDKTNIKDSDYGLDVINSLRPVTFDWNNRDESENKGKKDVGFIAQELQEIDDESLRLVYSENPDKLEASYGRLIPVMVKAIQELTAEVDSLKQKCNCKN